MDKLTLYRQVIREKIGQLADMINRHSHQHQIEAHAVFDDEHDQYLLVKTGWANQRRVRGTTLYLRLRDEQIWIEEDWTEEGITQKLVDAGVPEHDIVLAFQSPEPRMLSEAIS